MRWPALDPQATARPYRDKDLYWVARWQDPPVPVERVAKADGYRPRRSHGVSDGVAFYYCRSCNRRLLSPNTPFCDKHRAARDLFMRRLRNASTVHVPRSLTERLVQAQDNVQTRWDNVRRSRPSTDERTEALRALNAALGDLAAVTNDIASIQPQVNLDGISDDDHLIN